MTIHQFRRVALTLALTLLSPGLFAREIVLFVLPTIFRLFVHDPRAVAFHRGGLGVGLTAVRELVTAHGGVVGARSAGKNLGSSFKIALSRADAGPV